ncbi:MAG: toxic anion resistance protein [Lactimicrobium massiliense]|nr:toxic anion resistance protein [Lactimicrobium massiliense]MDD6458254.1 toxic anion resistance protein [Lactimicrobium massiliense]
MSENNKEAQAEPEIELTLAGADETPAAKQEEAKPEEQPAADVYDESKLSPKEQATVDNFAKQIDITQSNIVLQYGSQAQKKITDFSDTALNNVRTKDLGEVGKLLGDLVVELKGTAEASEDKGLFGMFRKSGAKIEAMKAKYAKTEANVDKIADVLEDHQIQLLKDIALLDQLYERNQQNTKELTMYIIAGKKRLAQVREKELPALQAKAKASGLPEDAQAANDLQNACDRFEKKLHDLMLTRTVSIQMAPQIRLVQNNDTIMTEKIQSTLVNTIPLWKNQMVLALGVEHSRKAMEAERAVNDMTNDLLKKNAETLHQATVDTAKESERGIVDLETLQHTNQELIATLDEVLQIQKEGHQKRMEAEKELTRIEGELHQKMLQVNQ